jgi:NADH dehydrogenase
MKNKVITVFGTGFIGKNLIYQLLETGNIVRAVSRNPYLQGKLGSMGSSSNLDICYGNIVKPETIEKYIENSDIIINLVGVLHESGGESYFDSHVTGIKNIAELSTKYEVDGLLHVSSIGADINSDSKYQSTKGYGEKVLLENFPKAKIVRPSIVFGPDDGFFSVQSKIVKLSPIVPMFGGGNNKFQPVYVKDLIEGIIRLLNSKDDQGKIYEFGGPDVMTMKEVYELILKTLKIRRLLVPAPTVAAKLIATFAQLLPDPIITRDLVKILKFDNVVNGKSNTLASLNINPQSAKVIVPTYLK